MFHERDEDDSFVQEFLARAKEREERLALVGGSETTPNNQSEVTYPPLSPLVEEQDTKSADVTYQDDVSNIDMKTENESPRASELNYSSDLSLECEADDVYRAEPVFCNSSPEVKHIKQHRQEFLQPSPRKVTPLTLKPQPEKRIAQPAPTTGREDKASSSHSLPANISDEQAIKNLKLRAERAEQKKCQLKKVVEISKHGSKEHIEAAYLLQIADLEHLTYTNHIAMLERGVRKKSESLGSLKLSSIRLKISSKLRNDLADDGVSHQFFCVASCGTEVKATEIIDTNDIRRQDLKNYIQFKDNISFADLPPDFVLKIDVYELVIGQQLSKLLSVLTPSKAKKTKITLESNFRRVGSLRLTLSDRNTTHKNLLQWSKHEESKYLERECKFQMDLKPEQLPSKAGMLHVRCLDGNGRPDWSRFHVDMSDGQIKFWKCEQDSIEGKKQNLVLEFPDICSEIVHKLTPDDVLYRQNSFVIYTFQQATGGETDNLLQWILKDDTKFKVVKHQFAAENREERESWCTLLDKSMHCFREWHGKTKIYNMDELNDIFSPSF